MNPELHVNDLGVKNVKVPQYWENRKRVNQLPCACVGVCVHDLKKQN